MNIGNMAKGMNDVERLTYGYGMLGGSEDLAPSEHGEYVRYTDYAALQQQLAAAREELVECRANLAGAEIQAARYRWLRNKARSNEINALSEIDGAHWDARIDEALATLQRDRQP